VLFGAAACWPRFLKDVLALTHVLQLKTNSPVISAL
jgi:hypothetical protein